METQTSSQPPLPHAAVRAMERYGVTLTAADVRALARRCDGGEGLMETRPDGARLHALVVGDRVIWAVYRAPNIVTVLPPGDAANKTQRRAAQHAKHRKRRH